MNGPSASPFVPGPEKMISARARLYSTIRTAHLERVRELAPATVIFRAKRYDFDPGAAAGLDLRQWGPAHAARQLASSGVRELEINEPLMRTGVRGAALAVAALRLRAALGGTRVMILTYAIENQDPFHPRGCGLRANLGAALDLRLSRFLWRQIDRVAFGTEGSQELYRRVLGPFRHPQAQIMIPALPRACACPESGRDRDRVVFVGAFSPRKGFDLLEAAWPLVVADRPAARLSILGKGPLDARARAWDTRDPTVDLEVDPPRARIHERMRQAQVLALPSQPQTRWREQVGLPIVEALSHGCSVVTTTQTGLADWLASHGHGVIETGGSAAELARAILIQLERGAPGAAVTADLPARDGRLAADDWLFGGDARS